MCRVDQAVRNTQLDWPEGGAGHVVGRLSALNDDEPVGLHGEKAVSTTLGSGSPLGPRHRAPESADFVSKVSSDDEWIVDEPSHDRLPVLYPLLLGLLNPAQGAEVVVGPACIARVGAAAPGRAGDVVVDDDGNASIRHGFDHSLKDVHDPQADEVRIFADDLGVDDGVVHDNLIRVGKANTVEAKLLNSVDDDGTMLDIQPARHVKLVTGTIPIDRGQLEAATSGIDDVATASAQRQLEVLDPRALVGGRQWFLGELQGLLVWLPTNANGRVNPVDVADYAGHQDQQDEEEHGAAAARAAAVCPAGEWLLRVVEGLWIGQAVGIVMVRSGGGDGTNVSRRRW